MSVLILAMGASNMLGSQSGGFWDMPSSLKVWNNQNNVANATASLGTGNVVPTRGSAPFNGQNNNPAIQAAAFFARQSMDNVVRLVLNAKGGEPLSSWWTGSAKGFMYQRMEAITAKRATRTASYLLWQNSDMPNEQFRGLIDQMRADNYISLSTPIVIINNALTHPGAPANNEALEELVALDPMFRLARVHHLPTIDGTHRTAVATVTTGLIVAGQMVGA